MPRFFHWFFLRVVQNIHYALATVYVTLFSTTDLLKVLIASVRSS